MKRFTLVFALAALSAVPVLAQDRAFDLTTSAVWADPQGKTVLEDGDEADFQSKVGYGIGLDVFWSQNFSTEFSASVTEPELQDNFLGDVLELGGVELIPVSVALRYHLMGNSKFDPYIGVGGSYVLVGDLSGDDDLNDPDIDFVEFSDEIGILGNVGFNLGLSDRFALNVDAKYIDLTSESIARFNDDTDSDPVDIEINPLIISAGLNFRF